MIVVTYKCSCLSEEVKVWIIVQRPGETMRNVAKRARRAVSDDHSERSPSCNEPCADYIKVHIKKKRPEKFQR